MACRENLDHRAEVRNFRLHAMVPASSGGYRRHSRAGLQSPSPVLRPLQEPKWEYAPRNNPNVLYPNIGELHGVRYFHKNEEVETYPLFESCRKLLDRANEILPACLVRYINLVSYFRTISLHAKLIISTQGIIQGLQWEHQDESSSSKYAK